MLWVPVGVVAGAEHDQELGWVEAGARWVGAGWSHGLGAGRACAGRGGEVGEAVSGEARRVTWCYACEIVVSDTRC